jgi:hypothetical protein
MTHDKEKAAIDQAFCDAISNIFHRLIPNLASQGDAVASEDYAKWRDAAIRAHRIAIDHSLKNPVK